MALCALDGAPVGVDIQIAREWRAGLPGRVCSGAELAWLEGQPELWPAFTLLWTLKLPWHWAYHGTLFHPGVAQFAFGFYSVMLTSTMLGLITMVLFKPRSWCVYCPMGTMTQLICKAKSPKSGAAAE